MIKREKNDGPNEIMAGLRAMERDGKDFRVGILPATEFEKKYAHLLKEIDDGRVDNTCYIPIGQRGPSNTRDW